MKLKYLGTAAAEAVPAPFCECDTCQAARLKGGRNIRTRSQAIVDDTLLIDFPADTYMHTLQHNIKLCKVSACIITHPHSDHLYPNELFCRTKFGAHMKEEQPFRMFAAADAVRVIREGEYTAELEKDGSVELHVVEPFVAFEAGGYRITPLKADHGTAEPVIYVVQKEGKSLLYAHDTGLFPQQTMDWLENSGICFDAVSYDCTNVLLEWDNRNHMGLTGNAIMRDKLKAIGCVSESTIHVVNHFSHNGKAGYDQLVPIAEEKGFMVSYDGMEVEF